MGRLWLLGSIAVWAAAAGHGGARGTRAEGEVPPPARWRPWGVFAEVLHCPPTPRPGHLGIRRSSAWLF